MTIVRIGRKGSADYLEFAYENAMDAFMFYAQAKDAYREDDLVIDMTEEGEQL